MLEDGLHKVSRGLTTLEELVRVVRINLDSSFKATKVTE
jgi:hypothetical protein